MSRSSRRKIRRVKFSLNLLGNPPMTDFRDDAGLSCTKVYKEQFAYLPTKLDTGVRVFWQKYYTIQNIWDSGRWRETDYGHPDKPEKLDEADYLFRKLADTL